MTKIHDSGYKRLFSNKVIFQQLIETFVKENWVKELDFQTCEKLDKSFVSEHYKETESDVIYKIKLRGRDSYICILMEFQSTVERFMAIRVLNYISNFYMDFMESHTGAKTLPAVFPIVLYNGDKKWTAPVNISALIENHELLGKFALNFEYFKIAENEYSKRDLLKIKNIVSALFLTESYYDIALLQTELLNLFEKEEDKQAVSLFLNWFRQLSEFGRIEKADYNSLEKVYSSKEEVTAMLITAIEKERKKLFEKGIEKGMEKGKIEGKVEDAKIMLSKGMTVSLISEITGLAEEDILKLKSEL